MEIKRALSYLCCPECFGELKLSGKRLGCVSCQREFAIINGVPILLKNRLSTHEESQKELFEHHYADFPDKTYRLENWRKSMVKRVFGVSFVKETKTFLDVGCGATGYLVIEAARRGAFSFGADLSLEAVLKAKKLAKREGLESRTFFLVCSAQNLPLKPAMFDYISAVSLLEHLNDDEAFIKHAAKIIKRTGFIYLCVPNGYGKIWPFLWPLYFFLDKKYGHKRHYSARSLADRLSKYGFSEKFLFYNGHLLKFVQIALERLGLADDKIWWKIEKADINRRSNGVQLNAVYQKGVL
ncbi:MAG: methyltransferase domain-containing protein [bacterium]|nr:methyltransferase domain-containing protein [bacterium]